MLLGRSIFPVIILISVFSLVFWLNCNDVFLDIDYRDPCFEKDIQPLVKRDCSSCHENGEYNFRLTGSISDYNTIVAYCDTNEPGNSLFLLYATGHKKHPRIWREGSKEYTAFYNWVSNGARLNCLDENLGECQSDEECSEIACVCPDLSVVTVSKCFIDEEGKGLCANDNNCTESFFGICSGTVEDAGEITDATSDVLSSDISTQDYGPDTSADIAIVDSVTDAGYDYGITDTGFDYGTNDTGYDSGIRDIGVDTGYDSGFDAGADTGGTTVSFSKQIVPLIKSDCSSCHYAGQYGVKLTGTTADYPEVMRYVDINDPEASYGFLWWAAGGANHPIKWPKGSTKYNLFLKWVKEGAKNN